MTDLLEKTLSQVSKLPPAEQDAVVKSEIGKWAKVLQVAGVKPE